jgi:hypothetical protein
MTAKPLERFDSYDLWFVAPSETWTREQTRDEFAIRMGPEPGEDGRANVVVTVCNNCEFTLDCLPSRTFRLTLFGIGPAQWAFGVVEDRYDRHPR